MDLRDQITEAMQAFLRDADPGEPIYPSDIRRVLEQLMFGQPITRRTRRGRSRAWADLNFVWCDGWPFPRAELVTLQ